MSKLSINSLKQLFKTGLKPAQADFWNWMDSFWHKDEKIPLSSMDGLQEELDKYATKEYVDNSAGNGGAGIDDTITADDRTWSSQKISDEIAASSSNVTVDSASVNAAIEQGYTESNTISDETKILSFGEKWFSFLSFRTKLADFFASKTHAHEGVYDVAGTAANLVNQEAVERADADTFINQSISELNSGKEAVGVAASLITQLIDGATVDYNTLKKIQDQITGLKSIVGGSAPDGDSIVNTVTELLAVFSNFPEGSDVATLLSAKLNTTDVYNALDYIIAGKALDARQGKVLSDAITAVQTALGNKVDKNGTDRLMTQAEGTKLSGIAAGAQVNLMESLSVNGVAVPVSGKNVAIITDDSIEYVLVGDVLTFRLSDEFKNLIYAGL